MGLVNERLKALAEADGWSLPETVSDDIVTETLLTELQDLATEKTSAAQKAAREVGKLEQQQQQLNEALHAERRATHDAKLRKEQYGQARRQLAEADLEMDAMQHELHHSKRASREAQNALLFMVNEGDEQDQEAMVVRAVAQEQREIDRIEEAIAFEQELRAKAASTVAELGEMGFAMEGEGLCSPDVPSIQN